jgi:hypothetical protein
VNICDVCKEAKGASGCDLARNRVGLVECCQLFSLVSLSRSWDGRWMSALGNAAWWGGRWRFKDFNVAQYARPQLTCGGHSVFSWVAPLVKYSEPDS